MHILNTVLPVFLIIGIGFCLRWRKFFSEQFGRGLSKLTYWIGLPALPFYKTATAISSHIMAEQMIGRQNLSAAVVIVSTLLSIVSFATVLAFY